MRLLHTTNIEIHEFFDVQTPPYAILSHTWGTDEITFQDIKSRNFHRNDGLLKVRESCRIARENGLTWIWIDTCCIDKTSSAELSEAINSMYRWYEESAICYAYLSDLTPSTSQGIFEDLKHCRWFTRGWTLQELLAPPSVLFYNKWWQEVGTKHSLQSQISTITRIPSYVLGEGFPPQNCNVAWRFSWASNRQTTRSEDAAYCLMGLFKVNMSPLYGEGADNAFLRLQEEILKRWHDHTIFLWTRHHQPDNHGLLATSPHAFCNHDECFTWLHDALTERTGSVHPYSHLRPIGENDDTLKTDADGHLKIKLRLDGKSSSESITTPSLGPRGLGLSVLLSDPAVLVQDAFVEGSQSGRLIGLDIVIGLTENSVFLPLQRELISMGEGQIRRGFFMRPTNHSYGVRTSRNIQFRRQPIHVSQLDVLPKNRKMVHVRISNRSPTLHPTGHLLTPRTTALSPLLAPTGYVHCNGGAISLWHTCSPLEPLGLHIWIFFGFHGRIPLPWCCIGDSSELEPKRTMVLPLSEYQKFEALRSRYGSRDSMRFDFCDHFVHADISPDSEPGIDKFCLTVEVEELSSSG